MEKETNQYEYLNKYTPEHNNSFVIKFIAASLLLILAVVLFLKPQNHFISTYEDKALEACQNFVSEKLRSSDTDSFIFSYQDSVVKFLGDGIYQVNSYVDKKMRNKKGTQMQIRKNFFCKVKQTEKGEFQHMNIRFD